MCGAFTAIGKNHVKTLRSNLPPAPTPQFPNIPSDQNFCSLFLFKATPQITPRTQKIATLTCSHPPLFPSTIYSQIIISGLNVQRKVQNIKQFMLLFMWLVYQVCQYLINCGRDIMNILKLLIHQDDTETSLMKPCESLRYSTCESFLVGLFILYV